MSEKTFIDSRMSRRELWAKEKQQMRECLPHDKKIILDILSILIEEGRKGMMSRKKQDDLRRGICFKSKD